MFPLGTTSDFDFTTFEKGYGLNYTLIQFLFAPGVFRWTGTGNVPCAEHHQQSPSLLLKAGSSGHLQGLVSAH